MQVHIVTEKNQHLYEDMLNAFFRARYEIYVKEKGWMPESPDGLEKDQFDTQSATYLIGELDGRVIAGSRFVPTAEPHLLSEVFPHLCTQGLVRDPRVAEWTRGFILPEFRGGNGLPVMALFCSAVMEWSLQEGITEIGGIQEVFWLPLWKRFGWTFRALGEPSKIDGDFCVPGFCEVSTDALAKVRRRANLTQTNLVQKGPRRPFIATPVPALKTA